MLTTNAILQYFRLFQRAEKPSASDKKILRIVNDAFKNAISGASWIMYVTAVLLIASCVYYYYFERNNGRAHRRRRVQDIQHMIERAPPKRRLGAAAREREVYRNVLKTAHSYIYPDSDKKSYVVRQTRSGTIYGQFLEKDT